MRLYVLCFSDHEGIAPHIVAEVVRESVRDDPAMSLASALAGERSLIVTRAELLSEPLGRRALEAWEDQDDSDYRRESEAILAEDSNDPVRGRLRLVTDQATTVEADRRNAFFRAIALRSATRQLVEQSERSVAMRRNRVPNHEGVADE
jgi:hypothetical protein